MVRLEVLKAAVNCVTLQVDLQGERGARVYRARRASGPYEEVGVAYEERYVDGADLEPGRRYFYFAVAWNSPYLYPETGWWKEGKPVSVNVPRAPKETRAMLTRKRQAFRVNMGGNLDESNTVTKQPETYSSGPGGSMPPYDQAFEPNMYVVIENLGETDVVNPWVVANGEKDWWSVENMSREILATAGSGASDGEKAMGVWRFVAEELYDQRAGLSWSDDFGDPVKLLNVYGFDGCIANAVVCCRLAEAVELKAREIWLGGIASIDGYGRGRACAHDIFEAYAEGDWRFLDTDQMVYFLKRDNRTVAGSEDLSRDIDLMRRSHRNLGLAGRDMPDNEYYFEPFRERQFVYPPNRGGVWTDNAGVFTHAPGEYPPPHTMGLRLRPGEKLVRYWDNVGKQVVRGPRMHPEVRYSNGKLVYRPDLRSPLCLKGTTEMTNVAQEGSVRKAALHPAKAGLVSEVVWKVASPYAIPGAQVGITCRRETREDGFEVLFSKDGKNWRSVWIACGQMREGRQDIVRKLDACIELDGLINPALNDWREEKDLVWRMGPCYSYYIKVAMWAGSGPEAVGLDAIRFDTDIQCATRSLPSLFCGTNTIAYRDDSQGRRKVRVTYGWQEEPAIGPPAAPEQVYPGDGADVNRLDFEFRWKRPGGGSARVDEYHVQVSRYADFRWCVCPTFDRYVGRTKYSGMTRWQPEFPNLLNPDETYYWRVRARNAKGVWGDWSKVRSFVPHGPRLPVGLEVEGRDKGRALAWSANKEGNPPMAYRVHGSMEPGGFSASEENLAGVVKETCWPLDGARKGTSYRVVAVDARGVPSTPSDYVEI